MKINQGFFITLAIIFAVSIIALFWLHFGEQKKYAFVDAQKLVNGFTAMKEAKKSFEAKTAVWQANLDTLKNEAESKYKEMSLAGPRLSERERKLMEELVQVKQGEFLNYQRVVAEKIKKEDEELSSKVLAKVNDYIKSYGKKNNYSIILAATQYGNIVYSDDASDITDEVMKGLNEQYTAR